MSKVNTCTVGSYRIVIAKSVITRKTKDYSHLINIYKNTQNLKEYQRGNIDAVGKCTISYR